MTGDCSPASPRITHISWGRMEIDGLGPGRDFKLWPGGGRPWDWNETGTHHSPGIQRADVEELLDHGCRVVVLSRGMQGRLDYFFCDLNAFFSFFRDPVLIQR